MKMYSKGMHTKNIYIIKQTKK